MPPLPDDTLQPRGDSEQEQCFQLRTRATPTSSRALVHATIRLIAENIADDELLYFFQLALFEACTNVVCHAYTENEPGDLAVTLRVLPGKRLEAEIRDWGTGFDSLPLTITNPPPDAVKGRGLFIISKSVDNYDITQHADGVSVTIVKNMREDQWIPYE